MIAGLILAAGAGSRFDAERPKLLVEFRGRPLLQHALAAQTAVPELERVVVVLGARADEIRRRIDFGRAEPVVCEDWAAGQSASLRCGARALAGADKVIVTLGDLPLITPAVITRFIDQPPGTRAVYGGRPGHPVVLGPAQLAELGRLPGDTGARGLISGGRQIECGDIAPEADVDVDTRDDLDRAEATASG